MNSSGKKSTGVDNVHDCSLELLSQLPENKAAEWKPSVIIRLFTPVLYLL